MSKFKFVLGALVGAGATIWLAKKSASIDKTEVLNMAMDKVSQLSKFDHQKMKNNFLHDTEQLKTELEAANSADIQTDFADIHLDEDQVIIK